MSSLFSPALAEQTTRNSFTKVFIREVSSTCIIWDMSCDSRSIVFDTLNWLSHLTCQSLANSPCCSCLKCHSWREVLEFCYGLSTLSPVHQCELKGSRPVNLLYYLMVMGKFSVCFKWWDAFSIVLYVAVLIFLGCWVYVNMVFLQAHQEILKKLVDLIGITSIMEVYFYFLLDFSWYREDWFELRF
jgi:hypothetical protein